ncbi:MAG: hypothetical protein GF404_06745 [candidate division Zixibacteria bacterium]|nr:hypothetical protein [candidate division Zixibacteria bacterium]
MILNRFKIALFLALMAFASTAAAVDVVSTLSSNRVAVGDRVILSVKILDSQASAEPRLPSIPAFKVYSSGHTFEQTIINGKTTSSIKYDYTMVAQKAGNFMVGPITVKIKGREYSTQPLKITVTQNRQGQVKRPGTRTQPSDNKDRDDFLVECEIDRDTVYEGQQVVYSFRAYQRRGSAFFSDPVYLAPSFSGFWHEEFGWNRATRLIKGNVYTINAHDYYLFPVTPGETEIEPARVVITPDPFSSMFKTDPFSMRGLRSRSLGRSEPETLFTTPQKIYVKPLPRANRPPDFKGAVGSFSMRVDLSGTDVSVDETILMKIRISGKGNIKTVSAPRLPEIDGLDIRASGDTTIINRAGGSVIGTKEFEFSIIPEQEGIYDLSRLHWSYFDPIEGTYKTLKSDPYTLKIAPGKGSSGDNFAGMMNLPSDIKVRDILGAKKLNGKLHEPIQPLIYNASFWIMPALPVFALAGILIWRRRQERLSGDVRYRRLKRAHSLARKRLSASRKLLEQGNMDAYYAEISRALYEYIGDKFNLSAAGLTEPEVQKTLRRHNYDDNLFEQFRELIRSADFGRFAPAESSADTARDLLENGERWIVSAEQEGKKQK